MLLITGARLGQTHGYRRVFLLGVGVFTAASLPCGLAPSPVVLIVARVPQGAGAALMFPQTLTGIQLSFEGAERAPGDRPVRDRAVERRRGRADPGRSLVSGEPGRHAAGARSSSSTCPWERRVIAAGARRLPAREDERPRGATGRRAGVATLSGAVLLVVLPLVLGRAEGWPGWTWLSLAASVPAFAGFVAAERRVAERGGTPL